MRRSSHELKGLVAACLFFLALVSVDTRAASLAQLQGILRDQAGHPVANLTFSLVKAGLRHSLKTDSRGQFLFKNLAAGEYSIQLDTTRLRASGPAKVKVGSGEQLFLTVVLQQVFGLQDEDPAQDNYEIRTILRNTADSRLIFRYDPGVQPDVPEGQPHNNAIVEVYAGGMSLSPGSLSSTTLTNFGRAESLGERTGYVLGVQMASGDDGLWKVRGLLQHKLGREHNLEASLGYSRLRLATSQPMDWRDPAELGPALLQVVGSAETLALGLLHDWTPADEWRVRYGLEIDQVRATTTRTYLNPILEAAWEPWQNGQIAARVTHRRLSRYDVLQLPGGESLEMTDAIRATKIGSGLRMSLDRRYEIVGAQTWRSVRGEIALFRDQLGPGNAYRAYSDGVFDDLLVRESVQRGIRAGASLDSGDVSYAMDYVLGTAPGLDESGPALTLDRAIRTHRYHMVTGRVEGRIPRINTVLTGMVRVSSGRPISTLDAFNDSWDICNQSVNFFVRQIIPLPDLWGFASRLEALLDLRNILNQDIGSIQTSSGELVLVRNPRSVRGGISLNF
jgi:hypothetical protein